LFATGLLTDALDGDMLLPEAEAWIERVDPLEGSASSSRRDPRDPAEFDFRGTTIRLLMH